MAIQKAALNVQQQKKTTPRKRPRNTKPRYLRGDWHPTKKHTRGNGPGSRGYPANEQPMRPGDMIAFPGVQGYWKLIVSYKKDDTKPTKRWVKVSDSTAMAALERQQAQLKIKTKKTYPIKGNKVPVAPVVFKTRKGTTTGNNMFVREFSQTEEGRSAIKKEGGMLKAASIAWKNLDDKEKEKYKQMAAKQNAERNAQEVAAVC